MSDYFLIRIILEIIFLITDLDSSSTKKQDSIETDDEEEEIEKEIEEISFEVILIVI